MGLGLLPRVASLDLTCACLSLELNQNSILVVLVLDPYELRRTNRNWGKSQLGLGSIAHGAVGRGCGTVWVRFRVKRFWFSAELVVGVF
nr:hypothetical protein [Tanacetum cinerariifolium]